MMYATAGNLDVFLLTRSHANQPARQDLSAGDIADAESLGGSDEWILELRVVRPITEG